MADAAPSPAIERLKRIFLILFVVGYWYTGLTSLLQGRVERWRSGANAEESSPKPFPVGV